MKSLDDDLLLLQAHVGDRAAFGVIVRRHQELLVSFSARMLGGDVALGEDVAQETFLRLWRVRETWDSSGRLRSWLLRTAFRLCLDEKRRQNLPSLPEGVPATNSDPARALAVRPRAAAERASGAS